MNNLLNNSWVLRIIALFLAVFLFLMVNFDLNTKSTSFGINSKQQDDIVTDVPVQLYYDQENLVVKGVPKTVNVKISGPKSLVFSAKTKKDFEVAVYLNENNIGKQTVKFQIKNLSEKITAVVEPEMTEVDVQEKVSKEFPVEAIINQNLFSDGYDIDQITVNPSKVQITGGKEAVEKVVYVKAVIDTKSMITRDFEKAAEVQVLDEMLNKLDVTVEPATVQINVDVKVPSKDVPIKTVLTGTPKEGFVLDSVTLSSDHVVLYGKESLLKDITELKVAIDLNNLTTDKEVSIKLPIPDGLYAASENVKATIKIAEVSNKIIAGVPISVLNLDNRIYNLVFISGSTVDLDVKGSGRLLEILAGSAFTASIDTSNLAVGEYDLPITIAGPEDLTWTPVQTTVKVRIEEK